MAAAAWKADRGTFFYVAMAWVAVAAVLAGFSTTYFMPMAGARFGGPAVAHVHGWLFFAWIGLLVTQTRLVRGGNTRLHRTIGLVAIPLALAMTASGVGVGLYAVERDLAAGLGDRAYSQLIGVLTAMAGFLLLVAIAVSLRRRPDWHKRLMLLATIAVLWPAWFRFRHFMPWVPKPDIWLGLVVADSLILVAIVRDKLAFGRVHPVYGILGTALIAQHVADVAMFDSPAWRATARAIYSALT